MLDKLEALAKAAQGGDWIGPQDKSRRFSEEFAYLQAADPSTILRLVRVARAAKAVMHDADQDSQGLTRNQMDLEAALAELEQP